jgi:TPR repeat protein
MQGYVEAQYKIALAYLDGIGVEQDVVQGYAWLRVCSAQTHREAIKERGRRNDGITPEQFKQAQTIADQIAASLPQ